MNFQCFESLAACNSRCRHVKTGKHSPWPSIHRFFALSSKLQCRYFTGSSNRRTMVGKKRSCNCGRNFSATLTMRLHSTASTGTPRRNHFTIGAGSLMTPMRSRLVLVLHSWPIYIISHIFSALPLKFSRSFHPRYAMNVPHRVSAGLTRLVEAQSFPNILAAVPNFTTFTLTAFLGVITLTRPMWLSTRSSHQLVRHKAGRHHH